jgi:hypothetical protein
MPRFSEYETVEQLSIAEDPGYWATIWTARKSESRDRRLYILKSYASRHQPMAERRPEEPLPSNPALGFLEGIKALKEAAGKGGRCLAPIHGFGLTPEGAWYVTDFYERKTLKEYIARRGRVDGAALRQIVHSVVTGCLALKAVRPFGAGHGNLKPSNVLLAGQPRPLRYTPFHLTDPYPGPRQLLGLEARRLDAGTPVPCPPGEEEELRALGELVLQLVEGRIFRSSYDYNYPIVRSEKWDRLGSTGEFWREKCNRLLDPKLSLEKVNLVALEQELRPHPAMARLVQTLAVFGAFCWATLNKGRRLGLRLWNRLRRSEPAFDQRSAARTPSDLWVEVTATKWRQNLAATGAFCRERLSAAAAICRSGWNRLCAKGTMVASRAILHALAALGAFCWGTLNEGRRLSLRLWNRLRRSEPASDQRSAARTPSDLRVEVTATKWRGKLAALGASCPKRLSAAAAICRSGWNRLCAKGSAVIHSVSAKSEGASRRRVGLSELQSVSAALGLILLVGGTLFYGVNWGCRALKHAQRGPSASVASLGSGVTNRVVPPVPLPTPETNPPPQVTNITPPQTGLEPPNQPPITPTNISPPVKPRTNDLSPPSALPDPVELEFRKGMDEIRDSLAHKRFETARALCEKARKLKPSDRSVGDTEQQIQRSEEKEYHDAMDKARQDLASGAREAALIAAGRALDAKPWDTNAVRLRQDCLSLAVPGQEHYAAEIRLARRALEERNYDEAEKHAREAARTIQFDETATGLMDQERCERAFANRIKALRKAKEPQATIGRRQAQMDLEKAPFQSATNIARSQLDQGQLRAAWTNWAKAWAIKPSDTGLAALQARILQALKQRYEQAITDARRDLAADRREEALKQVARALEAKPGDKNATELNELIKSLH